MEQKTTAKVTGRNLAISPKTAMMVCAFLRGRKLSAAKRILEDVIHQRQAVPYTRFTDGVGHRRSIAAAGRYPLKASKEILMLLKSCEANAVDQGMTGDLRIAEIRANRASSPMRYGRHSRREAKRAHVYLTLEEIAGTRRAKPDKKAKKADAAATPAATPAAHVHDHTQSHAQEHTHEEKEENTAKVPVKTATKTRGEKKPGVKRQVKA